MSHLGLKYVVNSVVLPIIRTSIVVQVHPETSVHVSLSFAKYPKLVVQVGRSMSGLNSSMPRTTSNFLGYIINRVLSPNAAPSFKAVMVSMPHCQCHGKHMVPEEEWKATLSGIIVEASAEAIQVLLVY